jgi:hypothetical protein
MPTIPSQETTFLARFPRYAAVLDRRREEDHISRRLATIERRDDPFPHVWVEDVLSPEFYELLDAAWPVIDAFPPEERENRRDLVPKPPGTAPSDKRADTYDALPTPIREVWDFFVLEINRGVIGPWLMRAFQPEVEARLAFIDQLWRQKQVTKDYYEPPFKPQMNVGRMMMRALGYKLRPHADALAYLATALYYFPDELETNELGTTLYKCDGALDEAAIAATGKTAYFRDAGVKTEPAFSAPFRRNSLLAFVNGPTSAHGMEITTPGVWRRAYQSHLSIKGDHHHL